MKITIRSFIYVALGLSCFQGYAQVISDSYVIKFPEVSLNVQGPGIPCPSVKSGLCPNGIITLDPGHDDQSDSKRTKLRYFNEGRSNMAVAMLVRDLAVRCGKVSKERIRLIRWPGEEFYNSFEFPGSATVAVHQPYARLDGISSRLGELASLSRNGLNPILNLSLHANSSGTPKVRPDRVEVFYPLTAGDDLVAHANRFKDAIVRTTTGEYRAPTPVRAKQIQNDVRRKSFARAGDYAVLTGMAGPESVMKLLLEMFYMDSSQGAYLDFESNLNLPTTKRLKVEITDTNENLIKVETYSLSRLQLSSARGIYQALTEVFACQ